MFINPQEELEITDGENTIWVKAKMDFNDQAKIEAALMKWKLKTAAGKNGHKSGAVRPGDDDDDMTIDVTVTYSAQQLMLLQVCVKRWAGPAFEGANGRPIPCTAQNIQRLDPNEPLVKMVLEAIGENNEPPNKRPPRGEPLDPNQKEPSTSEA